MKNRYFFSFLFALIILITGCGGGGSQTIANNSNDNSMATVTMDSDSGGIADKALNVSLNPNIALKFSTTMNPDTVNANNIFLTTTESMQNPQDLATITKIIANSNNTSFSFSSINPLKDNTKYYVLIGAGVKTANNHSIKNNQFDFVTKNMTIPTVSILNPADKANNIKLNPNIQIQFSESVVNVNTNTVSLRQDSLNGMMINLNNITTSINNIYNIIPTNSLNQQTTYYLVLNNGISNNSGNGLAPTTFSFVTGDFTAPEVNMLTPNQNATEISLNPKIQIKFTKVIKGIRAGFITLHEGSVAGITIPLGAPISEDNMTYNFNHVATLKLNTTYYLTISNEISDISGNKLVMTRFKFTTTASY